jgi:hypothetical protein
VLAALPTPSRHTGITTQFFMTSIEVFDKAPITLNALNNLPFCFELACVVLAEGRTGKAVSPSLEILPHPVNFDSRRKGISAFHAGRHFIFSNADCSIDFSNLLSRLSYTPV